MTDLHLLLISATTILFILLIFILIQGSKIKKLSKRIDTFVERNSKDYNIEDAISKTLDELRICNSSVEATSIKLDREIDAINNSIKLIQENLTLCIQKTGVVRYNPFRGVGGELCFALALLDKNNDGIVLNTIFAESGCYTYCKSITNLESNITLSNEEIEALNIAKSK